MIKYSTGRNRAIITLNQPEKRNPLSAEVIASMVEAYRNALSDQSVKAIVITGAGKKAFSAGGDLSGGFVADPLGLHSARRALAELFRLLFRGGKPTIARVNGHALAGGFGLAVSCDLVVAVEEAKMGTPEIGVGLWPAMISAVLTRALPRKVVLELMMTGRTIKTDEAHRIGAVTRVVPREQLDEVVDEWVAAIASKSTAVLTMGRDMFYDTVDLEVDAALDRLWGGLTAVTLTDDSREGVSAFMEKRTPSWANR